jgi:Uma2 family endonuclease
MIPASALSSSNWQRELGKFWSTTTMARSLTRPAPLSYEPGQTVPMSYEEYLALPDDVLAEWVNGETIFFMTPKPPHAEAVSFLVTLLRLFARRFNLGTVRAGPLEMRILGGTASRVPDLLFLSNERLHLLTEDRLEGPADLAVEIISEDSVTRDRRDKYDEYARAGVREYWIADVRPGQRRFNAWARGEDGVYRELVADVAGRIRSSVLPGFWLRPEWLWQDPPPSELEILTEVLATIDTGG